MNPGELGKGKTYEVVFQAKEADFCATAPRSAEEEDISKVVGAMPVEYWQRLVEQLAMAGDNRDELLAALRAVKLEHREALAFLIANMPTRDLRSLKGSFLLENVELAYKARDEVPWGASIPHELFLNDVLPYANVSERRDQWRKDFFDRFMGIAKQCRTPGEAALRLNHDVFSQLKISYHATKRHKPDQSPAESMRIGYASCTGLSILLVDACRAVGIPARLVGTPLWSNRRGNHSWVEVWDRQWRFLGAAESDKFDHAWFVEAASQADPDRLEHRIYATSFRRTKTPFPLVWDLSIEYVSADDVTRFYTNRRTKTFRVVDRRDGKPVEAKLTIRKNGKIVAADATGMPFTVRLAGGQTYDVRVEPLRGGDAVDRRITLSDENDQTIDVPLQAAARGDERETKQMAQKLLLKPAAAGDRLTKE